MADASHPHIHVCVCICIGVCVCTGIHIRMYMYACLCVCVCLCIYIHTHIHGHGIRRTAGRTYGSQGDLPPSWQERRRRRRPAAKVQAKRQGRESPHLRAGPSEEHTKNSRQRGRTLGPPGSSLLPGESKGTAPMSKIYGVFFTRAGPQMRRLSPLSFCLHLCRRPPPSPAFLPTGW